MSDAVNVRVCMQPACSAIPLRHNTQKLLLEYLNYVFYIIHITLLNIS